MEIGTNNWFEEFEAIILRPEIIDKKYNARMHEKFGKSTNLGDNIALIKYPNQLSLLLLETTVS